MFFFMLRPFKSPKSIDYYLRKRHCITSSDINEKHLLQVDIFHVNSTKKNAADAKLKKLMKRFVETYPSNSR